MQHYENVQAKREQMQQPKTTLWVLVGDNAG